MLNFAEQTGSGAVIVVWSSLMAFENEWYLKRILFVDGRTVSVRRKTTMGRE
jgi:hypothetical protein